MHWAAWRFFARQSGIAPIDRRRRRRKPGHGDGGYDGADLKRLLEDGKLLFATTALAQGRCVRYRVFHRGRRTVRENKNATPTPTPRPFAKAGPSAVVRCSSVMFNTMHSREGRCEWTVSPQPRSKRRQDTQSDRLPSSISTPPPRHCGTAPDGRGLAASAGRACRCRRHGRRAWRLLSASCCDELPHRSNDCHRRTFDDFAAFTFGRVKFDVVTLPDRRGFGDVFAGGLNAFNRAAGFDRIGFVV